MVARGRRFPATRCCALACIALTLGLSLTATAAGDEPVDPTASAANAGPAQVRLLNRGQRSLLRRGARVELAASDQGRHRVRLRLRSRTFDHPRLAPLTEAKRVRLPAAGTRRVRLALTDAGRTAVARCGARVLRVRTPTAVSAKRELKRDTAACARSRSTSRAAECDFIGQQQGSLCLLPFPDDYYTAPTGRRRAGGSAQTARCRPTPPHRINAAPYLQRRLQPRAGDLPRVPGLDSPRRWPRPARCRSTTSAAIGQGQPGRGDRCRDRKRWPIWVEIDSNAPTPEATALEIHPATNFASGHRYIVALRDLRRADGARSRRRRASAITATTCPRAAGDQRAARPLRVDIQDAAAPGSGGRTSTSPGTSRSPPTTTSPPALHMRDDAFGPLGDTTSPTSSCREPPRRSRHGGREFTPRQDDATPAGSRATSPCPVTCCRTALPVAFELDATGCRPQRRTDGQLRLRHSPRRRRQHLGAGPPGRLRPRAVRQRRRGRRRDPARTRQRARLRHVRDRRDRDVGQGRAEHGRRTSSDLSDFPQLADRLQQGLLNELFLGRLMIHPAGLPLGPGLPCGRDASSPAVIDPGRPTTKAPARAGSWAVR